jgi:hypothetical protein
MVQKPVIAAQFERERELINSAFKPPTRNLKPTAAHLKI